jgi:hypothetical protein
MAKSRVIKYNFEANRATAKSAVQPVVATGKKKSSPTSLKAGNPRGGYGKS